MPVMYHPLDPFVASPVDGRWRWSVYAVHRHVRWNRLDDDWIRSARRFVGRLRHCHNEQTRIRLSDDMPDIEAAYCLHKTADKLKRAVVEARLLAGQSFEAISALCGIPIRVIEAYEALFFSVVRRLKAFLFILPRAVGVPLTWEGLREDQADVWLKLFAYQKGPLFVDVMLRYYTHGIPVPGSLEGATREQVEELALMLSVRAAILARVLPLQKCGRAHMLLNLVRRLEAVIQSMGQGAAPEPPSLLGNSAQSPHRLSGEEIGLLQSALELAAIAA